MDIQKREGFSTNKYVKNILRLRFLAPEIVEAILTGKQPQYITTQKIMAVKTLDWQEQKKLLNF